MKKELFIQKENNSVKYYFLKCAYSSVEIEKLICFIESFSISNFMEENEISVYFLEQGISCGKKGCAIISKKDIYSEVLFITLIQAYCGRYVNYGLCYGYSVYKTQNNYISVEYRDWLEKNIQRDDLYIFDLNIPQFESLFFDNDYIMREKQIAIELTGYIIKNYGENHFLEVLKNSGELGEKNQYSEYVNLWLNSIGIIFAKYHKNDIKFSKNMEERENSRYIIKTQFLELFFCDSMSVEMYNDEYEKEINYQILIELVRNYELDVLEVRDYLKKYINVKDERVRCILKKTKDNLSWYDAKNNKIVISKPLMNGIHEYVHYLTWNKATPKWMIEGLAVYIQYYLKSTCKYRLLYMRGWMRNWGQIISRMKKETDLETSIFIKIYCFFSKEDAFTTSECNIMAFVESCTVMKLLGYKGWAKEMLVNHGEYLQEGDLLCYSEAGSLVNYMIRIYGEESFFSVYYNYDSFYEQYGKKLNEMIIEWKSCFLAPFNEIVEEFVNEKNIT